VKGNLQTITSLLKLRARRVEDPTARRVLDESVDRVRVMALLHETLYRSGNPSRVDLPEYLRSVLSNLFRSQDVDLGRLEIETPPDATSVDLEMAIPLGLLVHELVSNALRHAFPNGRAGGIRVSLARAPGGEMMLEVADQGVGLPLGMEMGTPSSLGLQLAHSLAEQLGGALEIERNGGTRFRLRIQDTQEVLA
jgi:two-component sensor histidine kinase